MVNAIAQLEARVRESEAAEVPPATRMAALNELAWALRLSDIPRARELAAEARELAIRHGERLSQARAARTMAMTTIETGRIRDVFALAEESRDLFDAEGDRAGSAGSRDFLATLYEFIGDHSAGLDHALDALSIARELGDPVRQGYALSSVGGILGALGDVDRAFARLEEALALFEQVDDPMGIGRICGRLSVLARDNRRVDEALAYAQRAYDVARTQNNAFALAGALALLGELKGEFGDPIEAEQLLREAIATFPNAARGGFGTRAQVSLGRLLSNRRAFAEAETALSDALQRILAFGLAPSDAAAAHEALAELSERQGHQDRAIEHLREALRQRELASQSEMRQRLTHMEMREEMKAAKKDAEIHRLRFVELRDMHLKLVEAEKMAALGTMAAGTAHELNSPLGVLRSNYAVGVRAARRLAELAAQAGADAGEVRRLLDAVLACEETSDAAFTRMSSVAETFQRFTDLDRSERRHVDLAECMDAALSLLEPNLPSGVRIERAYAGVPHIDGWPRQLNQAFMTVLLNACEAIDGEGLVAVSIAQEGAQVVARVRDTGRGMSPQTVAHLFDVGFQERDARVRMRFGLSATYATVRRHGGTIDVQSTQGEGTTVTFAFPVVG